jgi:hypothetical protein
MISIVLAMDEAAAELENPLAPGGYAELLKYGTGGLILGIVLAALTFLLFVKLDRDRVTAIRLVLGFGLAFLVVGGGFWLAERLLNPQLYVSVAFNPKPNPNRPDGLPFPEISTNLDPTPTHGRILVRADAQINVDMLAPLQKYADEVSHGKRLIGQVDLLEHRNTDLASIATRTLAMQVAAPLPELDSEVHKATMVGAHNPLVAAAQKVCRTSQAETSQAAAGAPDPSCGIANLADGNVAEAQADFASALSSPTLSRAQQVATHNGLAYTYVLQGDKAQAIEQFKISGKLGDKDAAVRLNELQSRVLTGSPQH